MNKSAGFFDLKFPCEDLVQLSSRLTENKPVNGTAYHLVNAYTLVVADKNPKLYSVLQEDVLICDSKPLAHQLKTREPSLQQIRGADLMRQVLSEETTSARHYFLGSTDQVLSQLIAFARSHDSIIEIAGNHSPEFTEDFSAILPTWIRMITDSQATIVWVGLGTPKQDLVANELAKAIPAHVLAVGAAFDYLSGNIAESPKLLQALGLEWLYRLIKEPRRLGRRYLIGNYKFLILAFRESRLKK